MSTEEQAVTEQDEAVENTEVVEDLENSSQESEETEGVDTTESQDESQDDDLVVTFGDAESPPQDKDESRAPGWVRELRKSHREIVRENKELKEQLKAIQQPPAETQVVGKKPKLEDFDYDADEFEGALAKWYEQKRKADEQAEHDRLAQEEAKAAWEQKLKSYDDEKASLKLSNFEEAEFAVQEAFNVTQQGIILQGSEKPALLVCAIGNDAKRLKELSEIKDPVKFTFAIAKLEGQLKVTNKKAPPPPEKTLSGTGPKSGAVDSELNRLRAEAEKTGNYTKVIAYRRQKKTT